ncbi:YjbH domain-containing protein [Escherichia coli]
MQLFPWLETTLRYTDVRTRQYSSVEAFSGDQTYKDKAFESQTAFVGRVLLAAASGGWCADIGGTRAV